MLKTLKSQVERMLMIYPETRDSDITLVIRIWEQYYQNSIIILQNNEKYVALKSLYDLPREDNVKRIRAKIQNEKGKYLPTKLEIALKRGILEQRWRDFMGYKPDHNRYVENEPIEQPTKKIINGKESNILIKCPECGGGMRREIYTDIETGKKRGRILCVGCSHSILY